MKDNLYLINKELNSQISNFEEKNGEIVCFYCKQIDSVFHNMILEDIFNEPDLDCLVKYERMLDGGNQTR